MNPEKGPQTPSPEEIKRMEKSRAFSDAGLIEGGAEWETNEKGEKVLKITKEQYDTLEAKEMEERELREEFKNDMEEMDEKQKEVTAEIEKRYQEALELLFFKVQPLQKEDKNFLGLIPEKKWRELIEEILLFSKMQEGGKRMFVKSLASNKEFLSSDQEVFIKKGMEVLGIFIHIAILKEGGNRWLQERQVKREAVAEQPQPEISKAEKSPEEKEMESK